MGPSVPVLMFSGRECYQGTARNNYSKTLSVQPPPPKQFSTFFGLKLSLAVFALTEELSATLQAKSASCGDATAAVDICLKTLQKLRSEESFSGFFEEVTTEARQFCDEPRLPRQRQPPRRIDDGVQGHVFETAADFYRQQFFETVDHVVETIQARFDQESFGLPRQIEGLLVAAASGEKNIVIPDQVATVFRQDIDLARLKTQLCMVPDTFTTPPEKKIQAVIKGLNSEMQEADSVRRMLSEVDNLSSCTSPFPSPRQQLSAPSQH